MPRLDRGYAISLEVLILICTLYLVAFLYIGRQKSSGDVLTSLQRAVSLYHAIPSILLMRPSLTELSNLNVEIYTRRRISAHSSVNFAATKTTAFFPT